LGVSPSALRTSDRQPHAALLAQYTRQTMDDEERIQRRISRCIANLPEPMNDGQVVSTILTIADSYAKDDADMAHLLATSLALFTRVNGLPISKVVKLLIKTHLFLDDKLKKQRMN
jgi:hypothetical protein